MTTRFDEGPESDPDDPLAVILRPSHGLLQPPPGRFEEIRRTAGRRKLLRTAGGAGLACAAALLVTLSLHPASAERPTTPTVPLAPPPAGEHTPGRDLPARPSGPSPSGPSTSPSDPGSRRSAEAPVRPSSPPAKSRTQRPGGRASAGQDGGSHGQARPSTDQRARQDAALDAPVRPSTSPGAAAWR